MLSSITPLGERGRHNRWGRTAMWYIIGATLGGLSLGLALGGLGEVLTTLIAPMSDRIAVAMVAGILALALLFDTGVLGERVPSIRRQVNEDWLDTYRSWVYGGGFGWQLGLGVVTIVPTAGTYVTWLMALLTGSVWMGAVVGGLYGLARAVPLLAVASADNPRQLRRFHRRMAGLAPLAHRAVIAATSVALAGTVLVVIVGS